jgi:hypothetical protein
MCVPSQQLQGQLQKEPSVDTINYITDRRRKTTATWPILEIAQWKSHYSYFTTTAA